MYYVLGLKFPVQFLASIFFFFSVAALDRVFKSQHGFLKCFFLKWKVLSMKEIVFIVLQQKPDYCESVIDLKRTFQTFPFSCIYKIVTAVDIQNNEVSECKCNLCEPKPQR